MAEQSREAQILRSIIDETEYNRTPQGRNEEILLSILNETEYTKTPQSREEELLLELKAKIETPIPPILKRVTGNPVEFSDGADAPLVKCVSAITGSQDLHGYDKPWVGGAGKNKLENTASSKTQNGVTFTVNTDGSVTVSGEASANASLAMSFAPSENTEYIGSGCPSGGSANTYKIQFNYRNAQGTQVGTSDYGDGVQYTNLTGTGSVGVYITVFSGYRFETPKTFYPMIRLATETDPTFAPYSNICPITAYKEGEIEVGGRNRFKNLDPETVAVVRCSLTLSGNTYTMVCTANDACIGVYPNLNSTYAIENGTKQKCTPGQRLKIVPSNSNINKNYVVFYDENDVVFARERVDLNSFTVPQGAKYFTIRVGSLSSGTNTYTFTLMVLFADDTDTTFTPYIEQVTHATTFPSAIYRGSEDVVNGTVTTEWGMIDLSTLTWTYNSGRKVFIADDNIGANQRTGISCVCDRYNAINNVNSISAMGNAENGSIAFFNTNNETYRLYVKDTTYTDVTSFVNSLSDSQFAYELLSPTTESVSVSNIPIRSLSGCNLIESSTGDLTVDYITDQYQDFVDAAESALPNTRRKGMPSAMDLFLLLDPDTKKEPEKEKEPETETKALNDSKM